MHAVHKAMQMYRDAGLNFERDIAAYLENGYVVSEPRRMVMGRPIFKDDPERWLDPAGTQGDTWFLALAVGIGCEAPWWVGTCMPFPLPHVAWYRRFNKPGSGLHVWPLHRILKLTRITRGT